MRVLIALHARDHVTGSVRRLTLLAAGLARRGHDVVVLSPSHSIGLSSLCEKLGIPYFTGPKRNIRRNEQSIWGKAKRLFELWGGRGLEPQGYREAARALGTAPDVVIARNALGILGVGSFSKGYSPLIWDVGIETELPGRRFLFTKAAKHSTAIVFQSACQSEKILGYAQSSLKSKIEVLTPGVSLPNKNDFRRPRWMPSGSVVLHVATITPRKNQLASIRAFARALEDSNFANAKPSLVFVGGTHSPTYRNRLEAECQRLGVEGLVHWSGARDDTYAAFCHCSMAVLPSLDEGVPNVIQEALWAGTPTVASSVGGVPELIADGRTGWLHEADDYFRLSQIMIDVILNPVKTAEIASNGQQYARRVFAADQWVERYEGILEKAVSKFVSVSASRYSGDADKGVSSERA